jgi:hypothetical protein
VSGPAWASGLDEVDQVVHEAVSHVHTVPASPPLEHGESVVDESEYVDLSELEVHDDGSDLSSSSGDSESDNSGSSDSDESARPAERLARSMPWGNHLGVPFTIAKIVRQGTHIGFGVCCFLHHNTSDRRGVTCKKTLNFGTGPPKLTDAQAVVQLKRWL